MVLFGTAGDGEEICMRQNYSSVTERVTTDASVYIPNGSKLLNLKVSYFGI